MNCKVLSFILFIHLVVLKTSSIDSLAINHLKHPLGIDITENNFSFKANEEGPFKARIILDNKTIEEKEIKLENSHSFSFDTTLEYNKIYKYEVESSTSKAELEFETAIKLEKASFIKPKYKTIFSPIFYKEFNLNKAQIKRARLYITGLGLYRAFINDERVGNSYLTPGYNDYDYYLRYQTYYYHKSLKRKKFYRSSYG